MQNSSQLRKDLRYVFESFSLDCLYHLRANRGRLIRGEYSDASGNGCLMYLLSETLPDAERIHSKRTLVRYFAGGNEHAAIYQPAKWIVRLWDKQVCSDVKSRYGQSPTLNADEIFEVLDQFIAEKEAELKFNQSCGAERTVESKSTQLV